MKKWSFTVAGLYGLTILALIGPLLWIAVIAPQPLELSDIRSYVLSWQMWSIVAIMALAQLALLRLPVFVANRRPVTRRPVLITIITVAFMMGLLLFAAGISLYEFFARPGWNDNLLWIPIALGLGSWVGWAFYFHRAARSAAPDATVRKLQRFLWTGSILELLVAVPTHIAVRHRDNCCAGMMTFVGLTCGISVMLFAFGPAVYFIFVERWRRLHPKQEAA